MANIASLDISLTAGNAKLNRDLKKANKKVKRFSNKAGADLKRLAGALSIGVLVSGIRKLYTEIDKLAKAARNAGFSFKEFQKHAFAFEQGGLAADALSKSVANIHKTLSDASFGLKTYTDAYEFLGITAVDINKLMTKSSEQQLDYILKSAAELIKVEGLTADVSNGLQKTLGRTGKNIVSVLQGYEENLNKIENRGGLFSQADAKNAEDFNDLVNLVGKQFQVITAQLLPDFNKNFDDFSKGIAEHSVKIVKAIEAIGAAFLAVFGFKILKKVGGFFKLIAKKAGWYNKIVNYIAENEKELAAIIGISAGGYSYLLNDRKALVESLNETNEELFAAISESYDLKKRLDNSIGTNHETLFSKALSSSISKVDRIQKKLKALIALEAQENVKKDIVKKNEVGRRNFKDLSDFAGSITKRQALQYQMTLNEEAFGAKLSKIQEKFITENLEGNKAWLSALYEANKKHQKARKQLQKQIDKEGTTDKQRAFLLQQIETQAFALTKEQGLLLKANAIRANFQKVSLEVSEKFNTKELKGSKAHLLELYKAKEAYLEGLKELDSDRQEIARKEIEDAAEALEKKKQIIDDDFSLLVHNNKASLAEINKYYKKRVSIINASQKTESAKLLEVIELQKRLAELESKKLEKTKQALEDDFSLLVIANKASLAEISKYYDKRVSIINASNQTESAKLLQIAVLQKRLSELDNKNRDKTVKVDYLTELGADFKSVSPFGDDTAKDYVGKSNEIDANEQALLLQADALRKSEEQKDAITRSHELLRQKLTISTARKTGKALLDGLAKESKAAFGIQKALAIRSAVINTYQGASKALAQGGIWGIILAAGVTAFGLAQVAAISSQQFNPPRRFGGDVRGGLPGLVGENGPELFVPKKNGTIIPNPKDGGSFGGQTNNTYKQTLTFHIDRGVDLDDLNEQVIDKWGVGIFSREEINV